MYFIVSICTGLLLGLAVNQIDTATVSYDNRSALNVAVIGAGASGLCAAKHSLAQGYKVTVYEQEEEIGGTWYYTDKIGKDKYGNRIHSSMYRDLRTNAPYQIMQYPDFLYPNTTASYPPHADVFKYLNSYANHFNVKKHIRLSRMVIRVIPIENNKWEIIIKNLRTNSFETKIYDFVFVCNGHNSLPFIPKIAGASKFQGKMIHSHDYRKPEPFRNVSALIIGGGSSGIDLVTQLSNVANRLTFSQHKNPNETIEARKQRQSFYSSIVTLKDDVVRFTETGAEFIDGSHQTFDIVFLATGYNYTFPFLSFDSGIYAQDKLIQPLYKHIFNVEHPTMAFIGTPGLFATNQMFDFQVRFAIKFISGEKEWPTKAEMLQDVQIQRTRNRPFKTIQDQRDYVKDLSEIAEIKTVPDVILSMGADTVETRQRDPLEFRKYRYIILDEKSFMKEKYVK